MQWSLIAVIHIVNALFGSSCASADDGKGQISSVFEAFGYSPACVASALTSCEYSSKKELSVDVVDSMEVTKSLIQELKSERENSASVVKTLLQELKSERENSASVVKTLHQEMKSERENSASVIQTLLQEMKSEVQAVRQEMKSEVQAVRQEMQSEEENSLSVVNTLLQEIKSEIGNSASAVKSICQEKSEREESASIVKTLLQEMKSEMGNSVSEINAIRQEMESQGENSSYVVKTLLQDMKSERENSMAIVKSLLQEMKSERENSTSFVKSLLQEMKSEVKADHQEMKSERGNSTSIVKSLLQEMKPEVQAIRQEMESQGENSSFVVKTLLQDMKSERDNSTSIVKSLLQEMKSEVQAVLQEMKSERENEKNSFEILLGNLENITHRISTLEVILQEATSERKNVSHSLADMKTFLQEMKTEQENDFATPVNNSKNKTESLDAIKAGVNIINPRKNCADLRVLGDELSGVRPLHPYGVFNSSEVVAYCDQVTDGGGWTVIQSRSPLPIRENFTRTWNEYVQGFGDPKGEFWLGLDNIHALTNSAQMELRVDLEDAEGQKRFAKYRTFHVGDAASKYVLRIEGYSGDKGDAMIYPTNNLNAMKFSTFDNDNDLDPGNCAKLWHGGWWFNACYGAHLNGLPFVGKVSKNYEGIHWRTFHDGDHSLKKANMKIRPVSLDL